MVEITNSEAESLADFLDLHLIQRRMVKNSWNKCRNYKIEN